MFNDFGKRVIGVVGVLLTILIGVLPAPQASPAPEELIPTVEEHIRWFFSKAPAGMEKALALAPTVTEVALEHGVDPLLVAVLIDCESSWRVRVSGDRGEQGLLQVHGDAAVGHDLSTPEGQVTAGVLRLLKAHESCGGDLVATLSHYQGGSCKELRSARWRASKYHEARARQGLDEVASPFHF